MIHHGYQSLGWGPRLKGKELSSHVFPTLLGFAHSVTSCLPDMASAAMATMKDALSLQAMNQNRPFLFLWLLSGIFSLQQEQMATPYYVSSA